MIADILRQAEQTNRLCQEARNLRKLSLAEQLRSQRLSQPAFSVVFDDHSLMKIKTAGPATIPPGGKVKSVQEAKAEFKIDFEDGSSATLCLADPGSSVDVRNKNNAVEYLG